MKTWTKILVAIGALTTVGCTTWVILYLLGKKRIYYPAARASFGFPERR